MHIHRNNGHSNEDCYQQQSEIRSGNFGNDRNIWCHYPNNASHSNDECYYQRGGKFETSSSVDGKTSGESNASLLIVTLLAAQ